MHTAQTPRPWWTFGLVWMLIAGPALVIVAGGITLWLAITRPDPVLAHDADARSTALAPAQTARNHAQTGVPPTRD
jgi:hypothetical protein